MEDKLTFEIAEFRAIGYNRYVKTKTTSSDMTSNRSRTLSKSCGQTKHLAFNFF